MYFLRENLGLGATVSGGTSRGDYFRHGSYKTSEVGVGFQLVRNVPLGEHWSFMLRPFIGYTHAWSSTAVAQSEIEVVRSSDSIRFASSFPFVYALSDAIGLGIGPDLLLDVLNKRKTSSDRDRSEPGARNAPTT